MTDEKPEGAAGEEPEPGTATEEQPLRTPPSQGGSDGGGQVTGEQDRAESAKNTDV